MFQFSVRGQGILSILPTEFWPPGKMRSSQDFGLGFWSWSQGSGLYSGSEWDIEKLHCGS